MLFQHFPKKITLSIAVTLLTLSSSPITLAQSLSKTPTLSENAVAYDTFEMPNDYPIELTQLTEDIRSYIVIDQETDVVLMDKDGNKPYPIASMSKLMPIYLTYQAIKEGRLSLEDKITIPEEIVKTFVENPDSSNCGLVAGVAYPVKDLMYGIMLQSGNDATSALMWHLYGNEQAAVQAIRDQLTAWRFKNFQFYTTSGLPNMYIPDSLWMNGSNSTNENVMSAADVARMAKHLVTDFPEVLDITKSLSYTFMAGTEQEKELSTNNLLLKGLDYGRDGVTGLKSGYTDAAGKNFVTTSTESGRKIIAVVMGVQEPYSSYEETFILLKGLEQYPELYQLAGLPKSLLYAAETNVATITDSSSTTSESSSSAEENIPVENRRDSFWTNLMRSIFSIFN